MENKLESKLTKKNCIQKEINMKVKLKHEPKKKWN